MTDREASKRLRKLMRFVSLADGIKEGRKPMLMEALDMGSDALDKWVPVSDRVPEDEQAVFVTYYVVNNRNRRYVMESYLMSGGKWYDPYRTFRFHSAFIRIIAWMPLPDPFDGIIPFN